LQTSLKIELFGQTLTNIHNKMKHYLFYFFALFLLLSSCKTSQYQTPNIFLISENKGEITLKATTQNNNKGVEEAQKLAIQTILFRGIANSNSLNIPLIPNENQSLLQHKEYFSNFFDKGFYKTFFLLSQESNISKNVRGHKQLDVVMKINVNALRRDLEQNGIIRKFGY
jgi:hypothetical protein